MQQPRDNIRVGKVSLHYSILARGWVIPGGKVVKTPIKAQRIAELMNAGFK